MSSNDGPTTDSFSDELELYAQLCSAAPVGLLVLGVDGLLYAANDTAVGMFGIERSKLCGANIIELVDLELRGECLAHLRAAASSSENRQCELKMQTAGGKPLVVHWESVKCSVGGEDRCATAILDVSERWKQSKQRDLEFRQLADKVPVLFSYVDSSRRYRYVNKRYEEFFKRPADEIVGKTVEELLGPAGYVHAGPSLEAALSGRDVSYQAEFKLPVGLRVMQIRHTPDRDESGSVKGSFILITDVTEQKKSEEALRDREKRIRAILHAAAGAIITIDRRGLITSINPATERMFGYSEHELINRNVNMLMPQPHRDMHDEYLARYLKTGQPHVIGTGQEMIALRKDGSRFPIHLSVSEIEDLGLFTGIIQDISAQKFQERKLRESERRYRALFHESPLSLSEQDWSGLKRRLDELAEKGRTELAPEEAADCFRLVRLTRLNKALVELLNARDEEEVLAHPERLIAPGAISDPAGMLFELMQGSTAVYGERYIETFTGERVPVLSYASVAPGYEETLRSMVVAVIDISDRKQAEEQQQMLLAELDHRVKNILTTVLAIAQQTLRRTDDIERFKEGFIGRLMALADVHRLLTAHSWQGVSLDELVHTALTPYREEGKSVKVRGVQIELGVRAAQSFYLILYELAANAAKYGAFLKPDGRLTVEWGLQSGTKEARELHFHWREETNGCASASSRQRGFGTRLIERVLSYELRGEAALTWLENGLHWKLTMPLRAGAVSELSPAQGEHD